MKYIFSYDETEHSRKINYETVTANNYYDNFITGIVGWKAEEDECISDRYLAFESKYAYRKKDGELKSQTMKVKDFRLGFASLNNHTIEFYEDLVSLFDEKIIIYFSVFSKIEYVISQLFVNYHSSMFVDVDYMKYSIIKAINVYRPQNVMIYKNITFKADPFSYNLEFDDRITLVGGDSGTGKTVLYEMLEDLRLTNEYKAIKLFNYKSDNFSKSIEQCRDSFIVVDNADNLINDEVRRFINFEPSNQYMLFLRNCDGLNVSGKSFKVLKFDNNRITLEEEL